MGITLNGATTDGWFTLVFDGRTEYREVSETGAEDTTIQQKRDVATLQRELLACEGTPTMSFTNDSGNSVVNPQAKIGTGTTWTYNGTYTIVQDSVSPQGRGSDTMINSQTLQKYGTWSDV